MNSLASVYFYDKAGPEQDFTGEIIEGLKASQKFISPKFFYDEPGSRLFTDITRQPEYYLTRTETRLLREHAGEISELIGDDILLVEYGSGSSEKIRILLENTNNILIGFFVFSVISVNTLWSPCEIFLF